MSFSRDERVDYSEINKPKLIFLIFFFDLNTKIKKGINHQALGPKGFSFGISIRWIVFQRKSLVYLFSFY